MRSKFPTWSESLRGYLLGRDEEEEKSRTTSRRLTAASIFCTPPNLEEPRCTSVHPLPTNEVLVRCMSYVCMRPSPAGWGNPEN
jgi:hypothetical protein